MGCEVINTIEEKSKAIKFKCSSCHAENILNLEVINKC